MAEKPTVAVELLKYPVMIFTIVLALIIMKFLFGLEFGVVTELSTEGVKFSEQSKATVSALAELEARVEELNLRAEALEKQTPTSAVAETRVRSEAFSLAQTVSDATAKVSRIGEERARGRAKPLRGYIWIGDFDGQWQKQQLLRLDTGQPVELRPEQILNGTEYRVRGNIVIRDGLPANDAQYFSGVEPEHRRGYQGKQGEDPQPTCGGGSRVRRAGYSAEIELVGEPALD